ncbi:MAG TPA: hypothetical protein VN289_10855 [Paraburkholderia sp.]|nr:hypothetical protein [Paraburkholderia sp.]
MRIAYPYIGLAAKNMNAGENPVSHRQGANDRSNQAIVPRSTFMQPESRVSPVRARRDGRAATLARRVLKTTSTVPKAGTASVNGGLQHRIGEEKEMRGIEAEMRQH